MATFIRDSLVPVPNSTIGTWVNDVARNVDVRTMETDGKICGVLMQKQDAAAIMYNTASLMIERGQLDGWLSSDLSQGIISPPSQYWNALLSQ